MSSVLSVVVPVYNVAPYLDECLESIAAQYYRDLEVVMVDDGSTDESGEIAAAFAARDPRFKLITKANAGLGAARNTGTEHATGEFLMFVDSDDVIPPHAAELLIASITETGSDFASGNVLRLTSRGVHQSALHKTAFATTTLRTHVSKQASLMDDRTAWNKVFRRSFWDQHRLAFPEGVLYEDTPVIVPAHVLAKSVDALDVPVYYWREREGADKSITQRRGEVRGFVDRLAGVRQVSAFLAQHKQKKIKRIYDASALTGDLMIFMRELPKVDDDYRQIFLDQCNEFLDTVEERVLDGLPAAQRVLWRLVQRRMLPELMDIVPTIRAKHGIVRKGMRRYHDLMFLDDNRPELPKIAVPGRHPAAADQAARRPLAERQAAAARARLHPGPAGHPPVVDDPADLAQERRRPADQAAPAGRPQVPRRDRRGRHRRRRLRLVRLRRRDRRRAAARAGRPVAGRHLVVRDRRGRPRPAQPGLVRGRRARQPDQADQLLRRPGRADHPGGHRHPAQAARRARRRPGHRRRPGRRRAVDLRRGHRHERAARDGPALPYVRGGLAQLSGADRGQPVLVPGAADRSAGRRCDLPAAAGRRAGRPVGRRTGAGRRAHHADPAGGGRRLRVGPAVPQRPHDRAARRPQGPPGARGAPAEPGGHLGDRGRLDLPAVRHAAARRRLGRHAYGAAAVQRPGAARVPDHRGRRHLDGRHRPAGGGELRRPAAACVPAPTTCCAATATSRSCRCRCSRAA